MTDIAPRPQIKRARTGCFKCRLRRRKCDEGKPACKRCVDGGFNCQYGTRLSFLEKNAKTVKKLPMSVAKPSRSYSFIAAQPLAGGVGHTTRDLALTEDTDTGPSAASISETQTPDGDVQIQTRHREPALRPAQSLDQPVESSVDSRSPAAPPLLRTAAHTSAPARPATPPAVVATPLDKSSLPSIGHLDSNIQQNDDVYESALDVLLSLGSDTFSPLTVVASVESGDHGGNAFERRKSSQGHDHSRPPPVSNETQNDGLQGSEEFPNCAHLPQDRVVRSMRQFRYNIAPWLDIGDPNQTFGLIISRMVLHSPPVLEALLSLSQASYHSNTNSVQQEDCTSPLPGQPGLAPLYRFLVVVFKLIRCHIVSSATTWQSPYKILGSEPPLPVFSKRQDISACLAASWIILRLDLSVSLLTGSPVRTPDTLVATITTPSSSVPGESRNFSREPLLLCADVINFCLNQGNTAPSEDSLPRNKVLTWRALFESLRLWYNNRPLEFKPVIELDESEQLFPHVLFTSGAALFANQMYHTAALILLQRRPRTLQREHGRSFGMSPLWHSQRICGISLNNDSRESWDFCLVASFYLAAKQMTYEPQQQAILAGLSRIGAITKWNLDTLATRLKHEWKPA